MHGICRLDCGLMPEDIGVWKAVGDSEMTGLTSMLVLVCVT